MGIEDVIKGTGERVAFLLSADRHAAELVEILRDTHRIMSKLEAAFDRLEARTSELEDKLGEPETAIKRLDRLEEAVLNIERATLGLEAAMSAGLSALPRSVQQRIARNRRTTSTH